MPVDAPDGTAATAFAPLSSPHATSIVGFPRESMISLAFNDFITTNEERVDEYSRTRRPSEVVRIFLDILLKINLK
jgi:ribosome biogenesis protein Tsr3